MPVALITGGASLIGEGIAGVLAREGWDVVVSDVNTATAQMVADKFQGKFAGKTGNAPKLTVAKLDVTDMAEVTRVVDATAKDHGGIDALVNLAGGGRGIGIPQHDFADAPPEWWNKMVSINLIGLLNVTNAVLKHMVSAKKGGIVSITARRGLQGGPKAAVYSGCKAATIVFSQSLAQEVGPLGIRVNTVAPGDVAARWKVGEHVKPTRSPLGEATTPDHIGEAVAFLLSEKACHITGSCIDVSGGVALH
ncbi:MAG TPA: SDR family oxidoreductase [Alphaproteobacteria bacterium]|jgi:NAD(P)-dependent dehydrogenase (short-subunit alcohol dehydrogenase family)